MGTKVGFLNRPERSDAAVPGGANAEVADISTGVSTNRKMIICRSSNRSNWQRMLLEGSRCPLRSCSRTAQGSCAACRLQGTSAPRNRDLRPCLWPLKLWPAARLSRSPHSSWLAPWAWAAAPPFLDARMAVRVTSTFYCLKVCTATTT
jgi:hypothetical protein